MRLIPEKVATPPTALTVVVPERVPPPGFVPSANVTAPVNAVAVLPLASRAVTTIDGDITLPAVPLDGCVVKASVEVAMSKAALVAPVTPVADATSVYPAPLLVSDRLLNDATPATAATVVVPTRVAWPGLVPIAMTTLPVNAVATLPKASSAETPTGGAITAPAPDVTGCAVKVSALAAAGAMANAPLVALARPVAVAVSA